MSSCERVNVVRSRRCFLGVAEVQKGKAQNYNILVHDKRMSQKSNNKKE